MVVFALFTGLSLFGATDAKAQAAACVAGETLQTFSFPAGSWTNGTTGPYTFTVGAGATAVNLTFQIVASQPFSGGSPTQAQLGNINNTVRAEHTVGGTNILLSTQNLTFNRPVNKLNFISADVDSQGFQDVIRTRVNGTVIPTSLVPVTPANITINAAAGTATANYNGSQCATNSAACNVTSNFNTTGITSASQAFETGPSHVNNTQFVGWNRFTWCLPARANITLRKTWVNATVNDAVTVAAAGGTPALTSLASVANTTSETDTGAVQLVPVNTVLTLSETFTTGSAANYNTALACTGTSGLSGSTLTVGAADTNIVCTYTNTKRTATVTLRKSWANATVNDAVTVSATGLTSLASVANTATETDAGAAQTVNVGSLLTLAEAFTTGSAANYNSTLACTGTSGLSGSTLTIGAADTAIVCTYTNTKKTASILITKTDAKNVSVSGTLNTYTISVTNQGPDPANGATISDTPSAGLTCPGALGAATVACTANNGAQCPGAAAVNTPSTVTYASLNAGVVVPTLPATGILTFSYQCTVN